MYFSQNFAINAILSEGVKPTLSELERFEEAPEGIDIEIPSGDKEETAHTFSTGEYCGKTSALTQSKKGNSDLYAIYLIQVTTSR